MATQYVVLQETNGFEHEVTGYLVVDDAVEAPNAATARRKVAEDMSETELDGGVTLIAVPARNWKTGRGTLKAETQRRIRPA
jgi:ectoine hydroxylase-related dioxygenase (phytanoyl-CoA dioxygenase family)